ncbi:MAG: hypothetical protein K5665_03085 [Saccharofermentans sp.]|nr:hypothetical protein [Saccharofermentans sp.]
MDYLEGLLLGRLWSDTDYENRKHFGLFVLYGLLVDAIILYIYILGKGLLGFGNIGPIHIAVFTLLFLANPFICFRYYRMPLWGKLAIISVKIFKSYLIISYTVSLLLPRLSVQVDDLQDFLIKYLNSTLEKYTEKFQASAGSFSTVLGVLAGGVHVVGTVLLLVIAAIVIPSLIYLAVKLVQYAWDWLVNTLIIKRFFPQRK